MAQPHLTEEFINKGNDNRQSDRADRHHGQSAAVRSSFPWARTILTLIVLSMLAVLVFQPRTAKADTIQSIQTISITITVGNTSATGMISAVTVANAVPFASKLDNGPNDLPSDFQPDVYLSSPTEVTVQRTGTSTTITGVVTVVEFHSGVLPHPPKGGRGDVRRRRGHEEDEESAHPVVGEALPHLREEERGQPPRMPEEFLVRASGRRRVASDRAHRLVQSSE